VILSKFALKLSFGSGIKFVVSKSVQPIRTVHSEKQADRPTDSPTWSGSLGQ